MLYNINDRGVDSLPWKINWNVAANVARCDKYVALLLLLLLLMHNGHQYNDFYCFVFQLERIRIMKKGTLLHLLYF